ncbi:MAG: glycoside hydrolase family 2 [Clostridia bacterium]|nr:glycoside hydrolase family 2 [Clostridia bacterium]
MRYSLDGKWKLYFGVQSAEDSRGTGIGEYRNMQMIDADVPGNVELDLIEAGLLPNDIYKGENILQVEKYENYEWWYEKEFDIPAYADGKKITVEFGAVDTIAEYYVNGAFAGKSDNMFVPVELDITRLVKRGEKNVLSVHILSVMREAYSKETPMYSLMNGGDMNFDSVCIRKAAHCFGWDIMPRAVTSGIWRSVSLCIKEECEVRQLFCFCRHANKREALLRFCFDLETENARDIDVEVRGVCGDSEFSARQAARFKAGFVEVSINNPKLWWPYGYGKPNLYETEILFIRDGRTIAEYGLNVGIRTVRLERSEITDGRDGSFDFYINDVRVMCKGSSWVPMDAFHSRDRERLGSALELFKDIGCNMIRCWGGNVYEDHEFFDYCDRNGIMVWQDFAMACHPYAQSGEFIEKISAEAEAVVKRLRNHASVVLWCGDNEVDQFICWAGGDPNNNIISREIIPQIVNEHDCTRPYLASSPYVSPVVAASGDYRAMPEDHLWGPRDYFKSPFYAESKAHFVSETGYHGCPERASIESFIDEEFLWPMENNKQWILHSSDQRGRDERINLLPKQIKQLFGDVPEDLDEFIFASQVSQAEADKFLIENMRVHKDIKGGILWWNVIDGWPQFSDAVVDYCYRKKIAYDYIKRSQQPFALMFGEIEDWHITLVASNDTLKRFAGEYRVSNIDTGEILAEGRFDADENVNTEIIRLPVMYSEKGMLLIEWKIGGKKYFNHYLYGSPAFDLEKYRGWYGKLEKLRHEMG